MLLAVTITVATAGAQDPGPPPQNDPQAQNQGQSPTQGQNPDQGQQADPNTAPNPNDGQYPNNGQTPNDQKPELRTVSQQGGPNGEENPNAQGNNDQPYDPKSEDPKNSVARVSLVHGDVNMQRGDAAEWSAGRA